MQYPKPTSENTGLLGEESLFYYTSEKIPTVLGNIFNPPDLGDIRFSVNTNYRPTGKVQERRQEYKGTNRPPPWLMAFTKDFKKEITAVDKKLQGRILVAISKIADDPLKSEGNTCKPLVGEKAGYWRYRLGDYRLVYYPDKSCGNITLMHFAARGGVYD